jgi:hypothetical protein
MQGEGGKHPKRFKQYILIRKPFIYLISEFDGREN